MNFSPILHSLVWALFQNVAEAKPGQDAGASRESGTVSNGSIFAHCQNFDDYDRAFAILNEQGLLARIPFPEEMRAFSFEREFIVYELRLEAPDLAGHLKIRGIDEVTVREELVGCFLDIARNNPQRCVVISADQSEDELEEAIWQTVTARFPEILAGSQA